MRKLQQSSHLQSVDCDYNFTQIPVTAFKPTWEILGLQEHEKYVIELRCLSFKYM